MASRHVPFLKRSGGNIMKSDFCYSNYWNRAFSIIASARKPRAIQQDKNDLEWYKVENQRLFDFCQKDFAYSSSLIGFARKTSIDCLKNIIIDLHEHYHKKCKIIDTSELSFGSKIYFAIKEIDGCLVIFKDIEESSIWKRKEAEPPVIQEYIKKEHCDGCKYIYLMRDEAYLQVIGHNDDESDLGRGFNLYSIKDYIRMYFTDEYDSFSDELSKYIYKVDGLIGFSITKSLNIYALDGFKRIIQRNAVLIDIDSIERNVVVGKDNKEFNICKADLEILRKRYVDDEGFYLLFGQSDFSESIITAEWLYDSMKKADAIDFTVIGMGYFKAVEQLLYELIYTKVDQPDYQIKSSSGSNKLPFTQDNIKSGLLDLSLGAMATFVKDYKDKLFVREISFKAKRYVQEAIFSYARLRNGYFHKHNIHEMNVIESIKKQSWNMFFLLVSAFEISIKEKKKLGYECCVKSDYDKLCEYVDNHFGNIFYINIDNREELAIGYKDPLVEYKDNKIVYSGVYFKEIGSEGRVVRFKEHLPLKVYLGKLGTSATVDNSISIKPEKVTLIFDDGKFVGPSYADDLSMNY